MWDRRGLPSAFARAGELHFGVRRLARGKRRTRLDVFLGVVRPTLPILPYDARAAEWHGEERARLERAGRVAPFVDGQSAAIAVPGCWDSRSHRWGAQGARPGAVSEDRPPALPGDTVFSTLTQLSHLLVISIALKAANPTLRVIFAVDDSGACSETRSAAEAPRRKRE